MFGWRRAEAVGRPTLGLLAPGRLRQVYATNGNPRNAGLGQQPTSHTGSRYADASLWISPPGLSSNAGNRCRRGPTSNTWFQGQALLLAKRATFKASHWPAPRF